MSKMGRYIRKKKNRDRMRLPVSVYVSYLLIATLMCTGVTLSRYTASTSASDSARVAAFVAGIEPVSGQSNSLAIDCNNPAGQYTSTYSFEVTNFNSSNDAVSEVATEYTIKIIMPDNTPSTLEMKLYDSDGNEISRKSNETGNIYTYTADSMQFAAGAKGKHTYELEFDAYDVVQATTLNLQGIQITTVAEQVD